MRFGRRSWEIPEAEVTPETAFLARRRLLGFAAGGLAAGLVGLPRGAAAAAIDGMLPAKASTAYGPGETLTTETAATSYNNFYEFGFSKGIQAASKKLKTSPWTITIDGLVETPMTLDVDDLMKKVALEERIYRHRCVEAWSMVVPWTGFALADLVKLAKPKADAKYLLMESFMDPKVAPYQSAPQYPWPYVEGLTLAEATNDLAFLAVGLYGKAMPTQNGAPIRLVVPWKYGFKSAKSIVRFSFVAKRPKTFWEALGPDEYGFWANVNPKVSHPRWSQASERRIGVENMVPTRLFNGYEEQVAGLYQGLEKERLYM